MKILSVILLISYQVCAQDIITRELDENGVRKYRYQERFIERKDVKDLIVNSQDSLAKKYLTHSIIRKTTGSILLIPGAIIVVGGIFITLTENMNRGLGAAKINVNCQRKHTLKRKNHCN